MERSILLDKSENVRSVESEEQTRFVMSIVEALEIPFEWDPEQEFTVLDKIRLRKALGQYNVVIIDDMEGGMKIYLERDLIAEWKKATYILREDLGQLDHKKRLFVEMKCAFSSIFEEQATAEGN